jgi:hypothetical protein
MNMAVAWDAAQQSLYMLTDVDVLTVSIIRAIILMMEAASTF